MADGEVQILKLSGAIDLSKESVEDFRKKIKKYEFDFDSTDDKGKTLLIYLVENVQNTDYLWVVLEYFCDLNIKDIENEKTALHYACKNMQRGQIACLLLFGANTEIIDKEGKKPFEHCLGIKDELDHLLEIIEKIKVPFIQLTRKRRKYIKRIFDQIDQTTKAIDEGKLAM
jgi:hypothetical protein